MQGQVIDYDTTVPIAFAKITYYNKTILSNWEGKFSIDIKLCLVVIVVSELDRKVMGSNFVFSKHYLDMAVKAMPGYC